MNVQSGVTVNGPVNKSILQLSNSTGGSITNNGTISAEQYAIAVTNSSTLTGDIVNFGLITSSNQHTIVVKGSTLNGSIINNGTISALSSENGKRAIQVESGATLNGDLINNSLISAENGGTFRVNWSATMNGDIVNAFGAEMLSNANYTSNITIGGTLNGNIINDGTIKSTGWDPNDSARVYNTSILVYYDMNGSIFNSKTGEISSAYGDGIKVGPVYLPDWTYGQANLGGIYNAGLISGVNGIVVGPECDDDYYGCDHGPSEIQEITNTGEINGTNYGILNDGVVTTLNNHQGATGSGGSALTYAGNLPTFYNMIVYGDQYGQLDVDYNNYEGTMTFGIFGGDAANGIAASQLKSRVYQDVVMGVDQSAYDNSFNTSSAITGIYGSNGAAFGSYNGVAWMLTDATWRSGSDTDWDLTAFIRPRPCRTTTCNARAASTGHPQRS